MKYFWSESEIEKMYLNKVQVYILRFGIGFDYIYDEEFKMRL